MWLATTVLCEYLNQWNNAGPAEVAIAQAAAEQALAADPTLFLAHYAKGFLCRVRGQHQESLRAFDQTIRSHVQADRTAMVDGFGGACCGGHHYPWLRLSPRRPARLSALQSLRRLTEAPVRGCPLAPLHGDQAAPITR